MWDAGGDANNPHWSLIEGFLHFENCIMHAGKQKHFLGSDMRVTRCMLQGDIRVGYSLNVARHEMGRVGEHWDWMVQGCNCMHANITYSSGLHIDSRDCLLIDTRSSAWGSLTAGIDRKHADSAGWILAT